LEKIVPAARNQEISNSALKLTRIWLFGLGFLHPEKSPLIAGLELDQEAMLKLTIII